MDMLTGGRAATTTRAGSTSLRRASPPNSLETLKEIRARAKTLVALERAVWGGLPAMHEMLRECAA
jgi:hypothetical protein